jgi:HPt (histidine-containing phosphotransfer) domain-containing protein
MQDDSQPSLVREMIDLFLGESAAQVRRITEAHEAGDAVALRAQAHRFLSVTQNIGALRLSGLCEELEVLARGGQMARAAPLLMGVAEERERVHAALAALRMRY